MSESGETVKPGTVDHDDPDAVADAGGDSRVYHESSVESLDSVHDDRRRRVLINPVLTSAETLLVDTVEYDPGVSCPMHYHDAADHFFYVLDGEGVMEIEGEEFELTAGSVVWIGRGDEHRLHAREDGPGMRFLEYFSDVDRETVYTEGKACTWTPESE